MYLINNIIYDVQSLFDKKELLVGKYVADNTPAFLPINKDRLFSDAIVATSEIDIVRILTMAIHTSFGAKLTFSYNQFICNNHLTNSKLLKGLKFSLTELLQMLTTHPVKNLEPKYFDGNVFCLPSAKKNPEDGNDFGILPKHTPDQVECVFSENAANLSYSKFLTLNVHYKDKTYTLPELIIGFDCVRNLLVNAGIEPNDMNDALIFCKQMVAGIFPESAQSKQIYWAIDDYADSLEYILISPIPSSKMIRTIRKTAQSFYEREDAFLPTVQKLLGGTQAQNVSDLNGKLGGRNHLLSANLEFIGLYRSNLETRLTAKKPLVNNINSSNTDIILNETLHHKQKSAFAFSLKNHMLDAMALFFEYLDLEHDDNTADLTQVIERKYFLAPNDLDAIKAFSDYLYSKLIECWDYHNRAPDNEVKRFAKDEIYALVKKGL